MMTSPRNTENMIGHNKSYLCPSYCEIGRKVMRKSHLARERHFIARRQLCGDKTRAANSHGQVFFAVAGSSSQYYLSSLTINSYQLHIDGEAKRLEIIERYVSIVGDYKRS